DTGIQLAEVAGLTLGSLDSRTGVPSVRGKGNKERRGGAGAHALPPLPRHLDPGRPPPPPSCAPFSAPPPPPLFPGRMGPLSRRGFDQTPSAGGTLPKRCARRCACSENR